MTPRQRFLSYVRSGGAPFCSPQIGAGAGFDTRLAGKEWISKTTLADTLHAATRFDIVPLINIGLDTAMGVESVQWKQVSREQTGDSITTGYVLETPAGALTQQHTEQKRKGSFRNKAPVTCEADLDVLEYYLDAALDADPAPMVSYVSEMRALVGETGALDVQWGMQPYELLSFPDTVDTVLLAIDCRERFLKIMDRIVELDLKIIGAVAEGGADFVFLGGPAAEMISPAFYRDFIIPYSQIVTSAAHDSGLLVYSHICSPIEPFLTMGFYNEMGIDLFETLSPPPVGNIESLPDALSKLDPRICTRGNLGLDVLLQETPDQVCEASLQILREAEGRKHILAASDYLFYDIPEANVQAMSDAVRCYSGSA